MKPYRIVAPGALGSIAFAVWACSPRADIASSECTTERSCMDGSGGDVAVNTDAGDASVSPEGAPDVQDAGLQDAALDAMVPVDAADEGLFDPCSVGPAFAAPPSPQFITQTGIACQSIFLIGVGLACPGIEVRFNDTPALVIGQKDYPPPLQALRVQVPVLPQDAGGHLNDAGISFVQITATAPSGLSQTTTRYFGYFGPNGCTCVDSIDAGPDAGECW